MGAIPFSTPPTISSGLSPESSALDSPAPLACAGVSKRLRGADILSDVDLAVAPGESVALLGLNGAGKTSLLRVLLDFMRPDHGSVRLFGFDHRHPCARASLAYLPEKFNPSQDASGVAVLGLMAGLRSERLDRAQAQALLEELGFPCAALNRPVGSYSKGMLQKLGLAATMLAQARLVVMDEPMSGLDAKARRITARAIQSMRERGRALLFTSHAIDGLEPLVDRVALMHRGRIVFDGHPDVLRRSQGAQGLEDAFLARIDAVEKERAFA